MVLNSTADVEAYTRTLTAQWKQNESMAFLEQQQIALCAIQEHRIVHKEEVRDLHLAGGWRLVTSSADAAGVGGVGFALSPKASKTLSRSIAVNPRILWLQITGAVSVKTHVINVPIYLKFPNLKINSMVSLLT